MIEDTTFGTLAVSLFGGTFITVFCRKYALPTIVFLFAGGLILGPMGLDCLQPKTVESFLPAIVSLAVAIILFEGGLTLEPRDYVRSSRMIKRLLSLGTIVTWVGSAAVVKVCFNPSWEICLLAGSLVIVTGPTVIMPLLRRLRLKPEVASILHWEGVLIDAVGVFIAVFCFELVIQGDWAAALGGFTHRLLAGISIGFLGGYLLQWILRKSYIPDSLTNPFVLAAAVFIFTISECWIHESGLLSVTLAGIIVGKRRSPEVKQITTFKAELSDLLIGALFLLLVSRLDVQSLYAHWRGLVIAVFLMMLVVRPLNIWISALGSGIGRKEKLFLSWVAPRGIVAASMATLFVMQLESDPRFTAEASLVESFTFSVIGATVVLQGLTAGSWARLLSVSSPKATGWMLIGAHRLGRELARIIRAKGIDVLLVDTNQRDIATAKTEGLTAIEADPREVESITTDPSFSNIQNLLALTDNPELNEWIVADWRMHLGKRHVFAWKTSTGKRSLEIHADLPRPSVLSEELRKGSTKIIFKRDIGDKKDLVLFRVQNHTLTPQPSIKEPKEISTYITIQRSGGYLQRALTRGGEYEWNCDTLHSIYQQLVESVTEREPRISKVTLYNDLTAQERILPPFLGHGIAAPHAYSPYIKERICLKIRLLYPIPIEEVEEPIHTVYFILSPSGDPEGHLATLAEIARVCHSRQNLQNAIN